ncbi:MAG: hypothetical protein WDO16_05980 [Bacteroidota bacterium]
MKTVISLAGIVMLAAFAKCKSSTGTSEKQATTDTIIKPVIVSQPVKYDTDDPAIWINPRPILRQAWYWAPIKKQTALYMFLILMEKSLKIKW